MDSPGGGSSHPPDAVLAGSKVGLSDLDLTVLDGQGDRLELGVDAELAEHVANVRLDRLRADEEGAGDPFVPLALGEEAKDLPLPVRELREQGPHLALLLALLRDLVQQTRERGGLDQDLALGGRL